MCEEPSGVAEVVRRYQHFSRLSNRERGVYIPAVARGVEVEPVVERSLQSRVFTLTQRNALAPRLDVQREHVTDAGTEVRERLILRGRV